MQSVERKAGVLTLFVNNDGSGLQDMTSGMTIENDKYSGCFPGKSEFLTIK